MGPGQAAQEENINWNSSPFYLGNFFTKLPDNTARCNSCPNSATLIKVRDGNTAGLDSHLRRKHGKVYDKFLVKKSEVENKRREKREIASKRNKNETSLL